MTSTTATALTADYVARAILAANGVEGEPHPALLADTVNEVTYYGVENSAAEHGITAPVADESAPEWEIVKQEWEGPCRHPYCTTFHRRLFNAYSINHELRDEPVYDPRTDEVTGYITTNRFHEVTRVEWLVLHNGERVGDPSDTKRDARRELVRRMSAQG